MHLFRSTLAVLASTFAFSFSTIDAQTQSKPVQRYFTFSLNVADEVRDAEHAQIIAEGLVGLKFKQQSTLGPIVAAFAGASFDPPFFGSDLICPVEPGGGCRPMLNGFSFYGVQLGGQLKQEKVSLEVSSGPAAMHFNARGNSSGRPRPATTVLSIHTRVEAAILFSKRIGMVVTGSWRHVPKYDGSSLSANGLGVGLRIQ